VTADPVAADMRPATTTKRAAPAPYPEDALGQAAVCSRCPKLCRPTCPVQHATGRESVAPWRISATVWRAVDTGWDAGSAVIAASCTGCGACADACLAGIVLPVESRAARAAARAAGVALPGADDLADRIARTGSPLPDPAVADALAAASDPTATTALWLGCAVVDHDQPVAGAAMKIAAASGVPVRCVAAEACCGAAAADRGLAGEARQLATRAAETLADQDEVVLLSPGCARMVREEWPRLGLRTPAVTTAPEWADALLAGGRLPVRPRTETVAWHDPCTLVRGLGVAEPQRRVLAALGVVVREPRTTGRDTRCTGGGAAYPVVDPVGAAAVAAARAAELASLGAPVATACPEAARALRSAGTDVRDILELVADRLTDPGP
jgi:Fe-S oxidoreductase